MIDGAEVMLNANGSAPGQYIDTVVGRHRKIVVLLPGPPKELVPMFRRSVPPAPRRDAAGAPHGPPHCCACRSYRSPRWMRRPRPSTKT